MRCEDFIFGQSGDVVPFIEPHICHIQKFHFIPLSQTSKLPDLGVLELWQVSVGLSFHNLERFGL